MNKRLCINLLLAGASLFAEVMAGLPRENSIMGAIWEKCDSRVGKRRELAAMVLATFDGMIPENERRQWREDLGPLGVDVDDDGCGRKWERINEYDIREQVYIIYELKANKDDKRQFFDIEEAVSSRMRLEKARYKEVAFRVEKISGNDVILEMDIRNSAMKKLRRIVMLDGKWFIEMIYELPLSIIKEKHADFNWESRRDMWVERFRSIQFN